MKKIGILTYHRANNLGAVLQAYALQEKINNKDNYVKIINYKNDELETNKSKNLLKKLYYVVKARGFTNFRKKYLKQTEKTYDKNNIFEVNEIFDTIITGSDQVWNLACSNYDYNYFLEFATDKIKKVSYAASLGTYTYNSKEKNKINKLLNRFDKISIREKNSKSELDFINKDIKIMPDPVFLLLKEDWKKITPPRIIKEEYILVYLIQDDINVMSAATKYAKENNVKIINNKRSIEFILNNTPEKFLSWIENAECIFTNSFHGTALSLIYEKAFYADVELKDNKVNNRIMDLLEMVGKEDNIINYNKQKNNKRNEKTVYQLYKDGSQYLEEIING